MRDVSAAGLPPQGSRLVMRLMAVSVFVVAAAGAAVSAHAQDRHGPGGPGMMVFGGPPEHVGRAVDHMLDGLNASAAQRTQIKQIAMAAAADLKTQRDAGRALREKGLQIFAAPTVDAGAAEALRQQMSAQQDQGSKRMLQAMLDVAKVLTPEQRAKIGERMKERQAIMQDRMQRMHQERAPRGARPASQPAPQK
ncbi:MAG: Spy/CpxP family protein refolding chaperone [Burkholderiales bacterium]